jgi:hypothetical protein
MGCSAGLYNNAQGQQAKEDNNQPLQHLVFPFIHWVHGIFI